jgi:hypothetical protein
MADETKRTVIENGTEIEGAIKSDRAIVLSGSVKGQVTAPSLDVTQDGSIKGTVKVNRFACRGEVGGEVMAEAVELSGRILDATVIRSKTLDVKLAQGDGGVEVTFGNCELQVGDLPAKPAAKSATSTTESSKTAPKPQAVGPDVVDVVSDLMK